MSMMLSHAVDEAFERLTRLYGREFTGKFDGGDLAEVKAQWARELTSIASPLDAIAWALRNLPERPPNAIQFRNLCRLAPSRHQAAMQLDHGPVRGPTPDELAALHALRDSVVYRRPSRQWAHDLIAKHERGESVGSCALKMAREVARVVPRETEDEDELPVATGKPLDPWTEFYNEELPC